MKFSLVSGALALLLLAGCVTPPPPPPEHDEQFAALQLQIAEMQGALTLAIQGSCDVESLEKAENDIAELRKELAAAKKSASSARKKVKKLEKQCDVPKSEKLVFGEIEKVLFEDEELEFTARIDTGAETSSLGVYELSEFERDGKEWVRFKLKKSSKAPFFEYRIRDDVKIKQRRQDGVDQRFEVKMDIKVGGKKYRRQLFNLADRSHLDHQVLLGRSFLLDIAIVDVSLKNQQSKRRKK